MKRAIVLTVVSIVLPALPAFAAEEKRTGPTAMMHGTGSMQMSDMMQSCMKKCQATTSAIDKTLKVIDAAKDSDDVAKLKDALDQARRQLTEMRSSMTECMGMMKKMQGMHGSASASPVDTLVKAYLKAQQMLVDDKFDGVPEQFATMHESAATLANGEKSKVAEPAKQIVSASGKPDDITTARSQFKQISKSVILLVELSPPSASAAPALYEVYCPMAKADWLQPSKQIQNPYMGQSMPECGKIQRKLKTGAPQNGG